MRAVRAAAVGAVAVGLGCTTLLGVDKEYYAADQAAGGEGGVGSGGGGGSGGRPECSAGEIGCEANSPRFCRDDGTWKALTACVGQTCVDGSCRGICEPGQRQCDGNTPQECDGIGQWVSRAECAGQTCSGGECMGECTAGEKRCSGSKPQDCDMEGHWQGEASCLDAGGICQAGSCISQPSCAGLGATCGLSGGEDCCAWRAIPGGTYSRSNDPAYPASVSDFVLDRFEITVGRFRKFVAAYPTSKPAAGAGAHPLIAGTGWKAEWDTNLPADQAALIAAANCSPSYQTWTGTQGANESLPMNCMSWYVAFAFCAWDGGRLPTEAEWNYAAAGGSEQREHPWSVPPSSTTIDETYAVYDCRGNGDTGNVCNLSDILNVGSRPNGDGLWGHADLGGSMMEWNFDWYDTQYQSQCADCANMQPASSRVTRGASWNYNYDATPISLSARRFNGIPSTRYSSIGARCARAL